MLILKKMLILVLSLMRIISEHDSKNLPFRGLEQIDWKIMFEPTISAHISIKQRNKEVQNFELNERNLSKTSGNGAWDYKRNIIISLNLQTRQLLHNGKVCANPHPGDHRGWVCQEYKDVSLFGW
jgi:hypothetical protein